MAVVQQADRAALEPVALRSRRNQPILVSWGWLLCNQPIAPPLEMLG
jgi:hypothetical protein